MENEKRRKEKNHLPLELQKIFDMDAMRIRVDQLSPLQQQHAHLLLPELFDNGVNPFREGKEEQDYTYETPLDLEKELFYLHALMDPRVLEQGNVRRFPEGINEGYISEKYFDDKWVSEANNRLSNLVEQYLSARIEQFREQEEIHLLDVGPCGGSITTLFALRALDRMGLLDKVQIHMVDIVPNVLEATILGRYQVPQEMIDEYDLEFAGAGGEQYKAMLGNGVMHGVEEWYAKGNPKTSMTDAALQLSEVNQENARVHYYRGDGEALPVELEGTVDIALAAYVHHHMHIPGRQRLSAQMESALKPGGMLGVADFYVPSFEDYMAWYKPHFEAGGAPPVECPIVPGEVLQSMYANTETGLDTQLENSFVLAGVKQ